MKKNKSHKLLIILILLFLVTIFIFVGFKILYKEPAITLKVVENTTFEINTEIKNMELLDKIEDEKIEILSEEENIDTSKLGTFTYNFKVKRKKTEIEYPIEYTIVDKTNPVLEVKSEIIEIEEGTEINLLDNVTATDNSKEEIQVSVEGEYNFDNEGTYNLKYVAIDSSNNKKEEEFTLKVNKKPTINNSNNNHNNSTSNNQSNNTIVSEPDQSTSNYPTLAPYTIVPANEVHDAVMNPNNNVNRTTFFWYVSNVKEYNGVIVEVNWDVSCNTVKTVAAKDKAKAYMPAAPTGQQAIDLYNSNPNIHYGETTLYVSY